MYDQDFWNSLTKRQQITIVSNTMRGAIIDSFIMVECIMADMVVVIDHNCNYEDYFRTFKSTKKIVENFLNCYDKIQSVCDKYFINKDAFKTDIEYLTDIRNRVAHFTLITDGAGIEVSEPFGNIHYFSYRKSNRDCFAISGNFASEYQQVIIQFAIRLGQIQKEVYSTLGNVPQKQTAYDLLPSCDYLNMEHSFSSLK